MKLVCDVCVSNRLLPSLAIKAGRYVKSTLALCKNPKSNNYCFLLFSSNNKNGTKYNLNQENIIKVLTRFVSEGKVTIQLKDPPIDLLISNAITIQLKAFLHLVKRILEGKILPNELTYSSMSVRPVAAKDLPIKKLVIQKRSDYPMKGFPKTLEILKIIDIRRCSLDRTILDLKKLKILDLSKNLIENLPDEFSKLQIAELNLSNNHFHKSSQKQWNWMGGNLSESLKFLNLEFNELNYLPEQISKLYNLSTLILNNNELQTIPTGIGNLLQLKILQLSNNHLQILPGNIRKLRLEELDLSNNNFIIRGNAYLIKGGKQFWSLKEIAGSRVLELKTQYEEILPSTIIEFLNRAYYCICGKAYFHKYLTSMQTIMLDTIAKSFTVSLGKPNSVSVECGFCSLECMRNDTRNRHPVT